MSNAIAIPTSQLPSTSLGLDSDFDALSQATDYNGRLKLYTKGKPIDKGIIRGGHWGIPSGDEDIEDLGETVDVLPLARRAEAIDLSDPDAVIKCYDPQHPEWARIKDLADASGENGCIYGINFLVYERSTGRLLECSFANKSARREAGKVFPFLPATEARIAQLEAAGKDVSNLTPHGPVPMTLKSKLIETKKYSWHAPVVQRCSAPFEMSIPMDKVIEEITKFVNPKPTEGAEKAEQTSKRAR